MSNSTITTSRPYIDMLGQEINVGDYVVYATTSGRSPVQKYAVVEKVIWTPEEKRVWTKDRASVNIETIEIVKVGVREISNSRGFFRGDVYTYDKEERKYAVDPNKKARVTYPLVENIVKVNKPNES